MNEKLIFAEIPDKINEEWRNGSIIGGMSGLFWRTIKIANTFKVTGDLLIEHMLGNLDDIDELIYPALFNYRQAIELYLKSFLTNPPKIHNIKELISKFNTEHSLYKYVSLPKEIISICLEFDENDSRSTTFRYEDKDFRENVNLKGEFWIDYNVLKYKMDLIQQFFLDLKQP